MQLIGLAQERGARTVADLVDLAAPRVRKVYAKRSLAFGAPTSPGVYLFRDRHDQVLYVGRARDLRARLAVVLSFRPATTRRRGGAVRARANRVAPDRLRGRSRARGAAASTRAASSRQRAQHAPRPLRVSAPPGRQARLLADTDASRPDPQPHARAARVQGTRRSLGGGARAARSSRCRACAHAFVTLRSAGATRMQPVCATASTRSSRSSVPFGASNSCAAHAAVSSFPRRSQVSREGSSSPADASPPFARFHAAKEHGSRSTQVSPRRIARRRTIWPRRMSTRCSQSERSCAARRPSYASRRSRRTRFSVWRRLFHRLWGSRNTNTASRSCGLMRPSLISSAK